MLIAFIDISSHKQPAEFETHVKHRMLFCWTISFVLHVNEQKSNLHLIFYMISYNVWLPFTSNWSWPHSLIFCFYSLFFVERKKKTHNEIKHMDEVQNIIRDTLYIKICATLICFVIYFLSCFYCIEDGRMNGNLTTTRMNFFSLPFS